MIMSLFKISKRIARRDNLPLGAKHGGRDRLGKALHVLGLNRGVEVGVKKGDFSKILCLANPNIELFCVDSWSSGQGGDQARHDAHYQEAVRSLSPFNIRIIRKTSLDALADFPEGSLDFVYIDANHSFDQCCPDIIFWSQKVRSGGLVACHDYFHHINGGVVKAVDAYTHCHHIDPWYVTEEVYPTAFWIKP